MAPHVSIRENASTWNFQFHLCSAARTAGHRDMPANLSGPLAHACDSPTPCACPWLYSIAIDTLAIITDDNS